MDNYLSKPIKPEELAQTTRKWVETSPAAHHAVTPVVFDQPALLNRLMGNQALVETIVHRFIDDIPAQLNKLRQYLDEGDAPGARRQAHNLKGAAATMSAEALRATVLEAEQAALAGQLADVVRILPRIEEQAERFKAAVTLAQGSSKGTP